MIVRFAQDDRRPFQLCLLAFLFLAGISTVVGSNEPRTLALILSHVQIVGWCVLLNVGAGLGLAGMLWPGRLVTALALEKAGLVFLTAVALLYALALVVNGAGSATVATAFMVGFGVASVWRVLQIGHTQQVLKKATALGEVP